jgi:hypothetical protein
MPIKSTKTIKGAPRKRPAAKKKAIYWPFIVSLAILLIIIYIYASKKPVQIELKDQLPAEKVVPAESMKIDSVSRPEEKGADEKPTNNLPVITKAKFRLENINNMDVFKVITEGSDKDGDAITYTYEWTKNDEPVGNGDSITGFKRRDKIAVKITPSDGKDYGQPRTLNIEIKNAIPKIIEHKEISFDGKLLSYQVKATDSDGDTLSYSLVDAPKGMTIDSSGLIKWQVKPEDYGKHTVKVKVSDGQGGEVVYTLNIDAGKTGD